MFAVSRVNTLRYQDTKCSGCGMCSIVCPHGVFYMAGRVAVLAHPEDCIECGACELNCPSAAIAVRSGVGCAAALLRAARRPGQAVTCGADVACGADADTSC